MEMPELDPTEFVDILKNIALKAALHQKMFTDEEFGTLRMLAYAKWRGEVFPEVDILKETTIESPTSLNVKVRLSFVVGESDDK